MNNLLIHRSELIEIPIVATAARSTCIFNPAQNMIGRKVRVYGFVGYCVTQLAVSPTGRTVIPAADPANLLVTLVKDANDQFINNQPYYDIIRANVGGFVTLMKPEIVTLEKCFLTVVAAGTLATTQSAMVNVYYEYA